VVIIFNLWALVVGGVIAVLGLTIHGMAPAAFSDANMGWTIGAMVTVLGACAEVIGIRPRLFFMPFWFIGTVILGFTVYGHYGAVGLLIPMVAVAFVIWWMMKSAARREAAAWKEAQESLPQLKSFAGDFHAPQFWKLVKSSLCLPIARGVTAELLRHDLEVAQTVLQNARLQDADLVAWDALETFLKRNLAKPKHDSIDFALAQQIKKLVDAQIQSPSRPPNPPPVPAAAG